MHIVRRSTGAPSRFDGQQEVVLSGNEFAGVVVRGSHVVMDGKPQATCPLATPYALNVNDFTHRAPYFGPSVMFWY